MAWLAPIPLIAALAVYGVCLSRRRPVVGLIGLLGFGAGYLAVILDDDQGANSVWHLVWLIGLGIWSVALVRLQAISSRSSEAMRLVNRKKQLR